MTPLTSLTDTGRSFFTDYHLATLSTPARDGSIHVVAVGYTLGDDGCLRVITMDGSQKVRNIEREGRATIAQVAGPMWASIAGSAMIERDAEAVAHAVALYTARYRAPQPNPRRVAIRITPEKVLGSAGLWG